MERNENKGRYVFLTLASVSVLSAAAIFLVGFGDTGENKDDQEIETPTVEGGTGILSLGDYTTMNDFQVPCWVGYGKDLFDDSSPIYNVNSVILGNAWG
jgi:hypothetical protein